MLLSLALAASLYVGLDTANQAVITRKPTQPGGGSVLSVEPDLDSRSRFQIWMPDPDPGKDGDPIIESEEFEETLACVLCRGELRRRFEL